MEKCIFLPKEYSIEKKSSMEKEYFDGVPESEIDWDKTYESAVSYLNEMGFDVIEEEGNEYTSSHDYIEFLTKKAYYFGSMLGQNKME